MTLNHNSKWTISVEKVKIRFKVINYIPILAKNFKIVKNFIFHVVINTFQGVLSDPGPPRTRLNLSDRTGQLFCPWIPARLNKNLHFLWKLTENFRYATTCQKCPISPMPFVVTMESHIQIRWEFLDFCHQKYDFYSYQHHIVGIMRGFRHMSGHERKPWPSGNKNQNGILNDNLEFSYLSGYIRL